MSELERLEKLLEREVDYNETLEVGSEAYVASTHRIMDIENRIDSIKERQERKVTEQKKDRKELILEGLKIGTNVLMPCIGFIVIVAAEKEITFTGALKDVTKAFLPKKM